MLCALYCSTASAVEIYDQFPAEINPEQRYVIYSHGFIVEGTNPTPVHPENGMYNFPDIVAQLFAGGGFNLIAHHRPENTQLELYASALAAWVQGLLAAGVQPSQITLVGFSRGAHITAIVANELRSTGISTALMARCIDGDIPHEPALVLGGPLLSIYETTDTAGACATLAERSDLVSFDEISITTGRKHGAFYTPMAAWMNPLKDWINRTNHL